MVSVKVTSHGYYARFTRKRGAGSIDHFRFIVKIVSFESKLLVDRLTCPFVPGTAISNVSSASLSLSFSLCCFLVVLERGRWFERWCASGITHERFRRERKLGN